MFLNMLRTSVSMFIKMLKNIIVSIGCGAVIFLSHKLTGSTNQPEVQIHFVELAATLVCHKN